MRVQIIKKMAVVASIAVAGALGSALPASAAVRPAITVEGCSESSPANWARIDLTNGGWECFGYTGYSPYEKFDAWDFWAGNNFGQITYNWDYNNYTVCFGELSNWQNSSFGGLPSYCGGVTYDYLGFGSTNWAIINNVDIYGWGSAADNP